MTVLRSLIHLLTASLSRGGVQMGRDSVTVEFNPEAYKDITRLSKRWKISKSAVIRHLIETGLEVVPNLTGGRSYD